MDHNQQQAQRIQQLGLVAPEHLQRALQFVRVGKDLCAVLCEQGILPIELAAQIRGGPSSSQTLLQSTARSQVVQALASISSSDPHFAPHIAHVLERKEELGRGGMGVVYRVWDKRLKREAALKILLSGQDDPDDHLRFQREAEVMAQLDHPAIPPIYELGMTPDGESFMLMKVVEGVTLKERILNFQFTTCAAPEFIELLRALVKVSEAMAFAHSKGFIHRDLKPANIMIGEFGEVQVMDWGLSRKMGHGESRLTRPSMSIDAATATSLGLTKDGAVLGTPGYMPPEQIEGANLDGRVDVFALGCILSELLTGEPPMDGKSPLECLMATMQNEIVTPRQRNKAIPIELDNIVSRCLESDLQSRTASMEELGRQLLTFLEGKGSDSAARTSRFSLGVVGAVFLLGMSISWFALTVTALGPGAEDRSLKTEQEQLKPTLLPRTVEVSQPPKSMAYTEKVLLLLRQNKKDQELELEIAALDKDIKGPKDLIDCSEMCSDLNFTELQKAFLARAKERFPDSNHVRFKAAAIVEGVLSPRVAAESRRILESGVEDEYFWATKAIVTMQESGRRSAMSAETRREILSYVDKSIEMNAAEADFYFVRGSLHFALRDPENALKDYGKAIELRPRNGTFYLFRANLTMSSIVLSLQRSGTLNNEQLEFALKDVQTARRLDGTIVGADILLGRLQQMAGREQAARSSFASVADNPVARVPERRDALMGLGSIAEKEEDYAAAITFYQRAAKVGKDPRSKLAVARAQVLNGDYREALGVWTEAAGRKGDPFSLIFLARTCIGLNLYSRALEELRKIRRPRQLKGPVAYDYCFYTGLALSKMSRFTEACSMLLQAVKLFPQLIDTRVELIHAYVQLKNFQQAENQLREAKGFHPKSLKLVTAEISLRIAQKDFDGAIKTCDQALKAGLDKEALSLELARIFLAQGKPDAAGRQLNLAIRMNGRNPKTHYMLGEALAAKNEFRGSYLAFSRAYTLNYPDIRIQLKLGGLAFQLEDYRSALLHYNTFIQKAPTVMATAYILRAEAYKKLGNYSEALKDVNKTLLGPESEHLIVGYFARAGIYTLLNEKAKAITDYRRFLTLSLYDSGMERERRAAQQELNRLENR